MSWLLLLMSALILVVLSLLMSTHNQTKVTDDSVPVVPSVDDRPSVLPSRPGDRIVVDIPSGSIRWRTPSRPRSGVSPVDALDLIRKRIEYEQTTPELGSDANARALVELMRAIAILNGERTEVDGIPLIR